MSEYRIYLKICKGVKTEEDRQKMNKVYDEIWKHKLPLGEVMLKYFETTNDMTEGEHSMYFCGFICIALTMIRS